MLTQSSIDTQSIRSLKYTLETDKQYAEARYQLHCYYLNYYKDNCDTLSIKTMTDYLRSAFHCLLNASESGHEKAREDIINLQIGIDYTTLSQDLLVDLALIKKLTTIKFNDYRYVQAQIVLFEIYYYSHRCYFTYRNHEARCADIYQAFQYLLNACKKNPKFSHPFADHYELQKKSTQDIKKIQHDLRAIARQEQMVESIGEDTLYQQSLQHSQYAQRYYQTTLNFCNLYQGYNGLEITTECKLQHDKYQITVDLSQLEANRYYIHIDEKGNEIAKLKRIDNKVFFQGKANNIHLIIRAHDEMETLQINSVEIVKLTCHIESQFPLFLQANTTDLIIDGSLNTKNLNIEVSGQLTLEKSSHLQSKRHVILHSKHLIAEGKIDAEMSVISKTQDVVEIKPDCCIQSNWEITFSSNHFNEIRGQFRTKSTITFNAINKIYIPGGALFQADEKITYEADDIIWAGSVSHVLSPEVECKAKNRIVIGENSKWHSHFTKLTAKEIQLYNTLQTGTLITDAENMMAYRGGHITAAQWIIKGNSAYINMDITVNDWCIDLNRFLGFGLTDRHSLWDRRTLTKPPVFTYQRIRVRTLCYCNLFVVVNNLKLEAVIAASIGISFDHSSNVRALLPLDLGIHLPNFSRMLQSLQQTFDLVIAGNIKTMLSDLFSIDNFWNTCVNGLNLLRCLLTQVVPGLSTLTNLGYGVVIFVLNSANIYQVFKKLYAQQTPYQFSDFIPLISLGASITTQIITMQSQVTSLENNGIGSTDCYLPEISDLALDSLSLLGGNQSREGLIDLSASININVSVIRRSAIGLDAIQVNAGVNVFEQSYFAETNSFVLAKNYSVDANTLYFQSTAITENTTISSPNLALFSQNNVHSQAATLAGSLTNDQVSSLIHQTNYGIHPATKLTIITDQPIAINTALPSQLTISLVGAGITINHPIQSNAPVNLTAATGDIAVNADVNSQLTSLNALRGKIINHGGSFHSTNGNQISGQLGIENANKIEQTIQTQRVPSRLNRSDIETNQIIDMLEKMTHNKSRLESMRPMQTVVTITDKAYPISIVSDNGDNVIQSSAGSISDHSVNYSAPHGKTRIHALSRIDFDVNQTTITTIYFSHTGRREHHRIKTIIPVISEATGKNMIVTTDNGDITNQSHLHPDDHLTIHAAGKYTNDDKNESNETIITSQNNDVINNGIMIGQTYVEVTAPTGYVRNHAVANVYHDANGERIQWTQAVISGGDGNGHDGVGTFVMAGEKVDNTASIMRAIGKNIVYGKKGIIGDSLSHQYIARVEDSDNFLGLSHHHVVRLATEMQSATFASSHDRNILLTDSGESHQIILIAANLNSQLGTDLFADEGNVTLLDLITRNETYTDDDGFFHLTTHHRYELNESAESTRLVTLDPAGHTNIRTHVLTMRNPIIIAHGSLNEDVDSTITLPSELKHVIVDRTSGITLSLFGVNLIDPTADSHTFLPVSDPTATAVNQLLNSTHSAELGMNAANAAASTINSYHTVTAALNEGGFLIQLGQRYGLIPNMTPNPTIGFASAKTKITATNYAVGLLYANNLTINATQDATLAGIPVVVSHNMTVNAEHFSQSGVNNHYAIDNTNSHVSLSSSGAVALNYAKTHIDGSDYQNQVMNVGDTLTVNAETWNIAGAHNNAGHFQGHVKHLILIPALSSSTEKTTVSLSMDSASMKKALSSLFTPHQSPNFSVHTTTVRDHLHDQKAEAPHHTNATTTWILTQISKQSAASTADDDFEQKGAIEKLVLFSAEVGLAFETDIGVLRTFDDAFQLAKSGANALQKIGIFGNKVLRALPKEAIPHLLYAGLEPNLIDYPQVSLTSSRACS
jgi:hypothetical protein